MVESVSDKNLFLFLLLLLNGLEQLAKPEVKESQAIASVSIY